MVIIVCPKCKIGRIRIYAKTGYTVSLDLSKANQKVLCRVCKRKIQYSIQEEIPKNEC